MKQISLNGTWKCKHASGYRGAEKEWPGVQSWMPSYDISIPGTAQEAMAHLTGDVHLGHNVLNARWVEEETWLLSRSFFLEQTELTRHKRVRLVLEGVSLYAQVYVNGTPVGQHQNFFTPCRLDITDAVTPGENRLDIKLECGLLANAFKPAGDGLGYPREQALRRNYCRMPQSAFEFDWAPRLLNVGICQDARLEFGEIFINEASVFHDLSEDYSVATVRLRQFLTIPTARTVRLEAVVEETGAKVCWEGQLEGSAYAPATLQIPNPKLWHPRGHGEQYRYTLRWKIVDGQTGCVVQETWRKIGLRHVRVDQSALAQGGNQFRLVINGQPLFAKGANMIPMDILFSRYDRAAYAVLIDRALEANFNALRVWGGGIYESDDFYDLCDEKGIVVWQDFISACANYPAQDREFLENYREEIAYQVRRMSAFASLVILCGNNEVDWMMQSASNQHAYTCASLYHMVIPRILHAEGDTHYYQPSSPYSPDGSDANNSAVGDQHPWSIGFQNREYFGYRNMDCRFPNEGGILGPTSLPNMLAALGPGQEYLHSFDFKLHDNSIADFDRNAPERILEEKLGMRIGLEGMGIADYVYYGGFLQGEGLGEYILNFRRRMSSTTGSAIFWMYEDCWPATRSWTIVDYLRNRTPAFYPVKRAFAPIAVDVVKNEAGGFDIYGINDQLCPQEVTVRYGAVAPDAKGADVHWQSQKVTLMANGASVIAHMDAPAGTIPCVMLLDTQGQLLARRRWVDVAYDQLGLVPADIHVHVENGVATYQSDTLVLGVCLDLDGDDGELSDNFFDLYPGVPYKVRLGKKDANVMYHL